MSQSRPRASINRNDPCPCGSGRKYKKCCLGKTGTHAVDTGAAPGMEPDPATDVDDLLARATRFRGLGRIGRAIDLYQQVLRVAPNRADVLHALGMTLADAGAVERGARLVQQAVAADAGDAGYVSDLASLLVRLGNHRDALTHAQRAVCLDPGDVASHCTVADCLERGGRLEEARSAADRALVIDPDDAHAALLRARIDRRGGAHAEARRRLETIVAREGDNQLLAGAWCELGRVRDGEGDYAGAYEAFCAAGRETGRDPVARGLDRAAWHRRIRSYLTMDGPAFLRSAPAVDDGLRAPAFLVGFSRSGTTMTEQILAAHPGVATSDERMLVYALRRRMAEMFEGSHDVPGMLACLSAEDIGTLRELYWRTAAAEVKSTFEGKLLIDKNPLDLIDAVLINTIFPDARLIVALRDPRDVCVSCFMQPFVLNEANVHFLTLEDTVAFYADVMGLWLHVRSLLTMPFMELRYEDVVADDEGAARRLLDFLGLPWHEAVLRFWEVARTRSIATPSYEAVREPIHDRAVQRWRRYASQLEPLLPKLDRFVRAFGYE